jgi:hypothetical protein
MYKARNILQYDTGYVEFTDASAFNNERGELVIQRQGEIIAVFKEWIYWEKVE